MGANYRRLTGHVAANVLKRSAVACALCLVVYVAIDIVETSSLTGVGDAFIVPYLFKLPSVLTHILPLAVLVGTQLTLASMRSGGQWDALRAAGVSPHALMGSLLTVSWGAAALSLLLVTWIAPAGLSIWHGRLAADATGLQTADDHRIGWMVRDGLLIHQGNHGELRIQRSAEGLPLVRVEMGNHDTDGKALVWRTGRGWREEAVPRGATGVNDATLLAGLVFSSATGMPGDSLTVPALLEAIPLALQRGLNPAPLQAEFALRIALIAACAVIPLLCLGLGAGMESVSAARMVAWGMAAAAAYWFCLAVAWNSVAAGVVAPYWLYAVVPLCFAVLGCLAALFGAAKPV